jgi:hypothetical protein
MSLMSFAILRVSAWLQVGDVMSDLPDGRGW